MLHQRSCIACRARMEKVKLLRFVYDGKQVVWDKEQCLPGRGAYVHPWAACWEKAARIELFKRALRLGAGIVFDHSAALDQARVAVVGLDQSGDGPKRSQAKRVRL